jgi:DNA gyrase subunit A
MLDNAERDTKRRNHDRKTRREQAAAAAITQTLEKNYMPYAMSVIVSRAIPEIDGFKPSHRKLLYTMYRMGLLGRVPNQIGQCRRPDDEAQPHGDQPSTRHWSG